MVSSMRGNSLPVVTYTELHGHACLRCAEALLGSTMHLRKMMLGTQHLCHTCQVSQIFREHPGIPTIPSRDTGFRGKYPGKLILLSYAFLCVNGGAVTRENCNVIITNCSMMQKQAQPTAIGAIRMCSMYIKTLSK